MYVNTMLWHNHNSTVCVLKEHYFVHDSAISHN